ncbi:MAG TPA: TPM domain-containing protein [Flavobacteriales bacterium]|nr:TPM domain-containing protein [Flavobacteriales bacterium]
MSVINAAEFLTEAERTRVAQAIGQAEQRTAGEIRVHLEDHIEDDVLDHAAFVFEELGMHRTRDHSGVLIYICAADRKVAVVGDKGINERVPPDFWADVVAVLKLRFAAGQRAEGLCEAVAMVGEKLVAFFPRRVDDTDELSNEVSFDH